MTPATAAQPLADRIRRASFALTLGVIGTVVAVMIGIALFEIPEDREEAHLAAIGVLGGTLAGDLDNQLTNLRELSRSPLVWTSLSDSAGRDADLKPFLAARTGTPGSLPAALVDYRGRAVAGSLPDRVPQAEIDRTVQGALGERQARARVLAEPGQALLLVAFPVIYPYTSDAIGALVSVIDLGALLERRAKGLAAGLGVEMRQADRLLLGLPGAAPGRWFLIRTSCSGRAGAEGGALGLRLYGLDNPWITPTLPAAGHHEHAGAGAGRAQLAPGRRARAAAGRTPRHPGLGELRGHLARAVGALYRDRIGDEIGLLSRTLRQALDAYEEINAQLDQRGGTHPAAGHQRGAVSRRHRRDRGKPSPSSYPEDRLVYCNRQYRDSFATAPEPPRRAPASRRSRWPAGGRTTRTAIPRRPRPGWRWRLAQHRTGSDQVLALGEGRWARDIERRTPTGYLVALRFDISELVRALQQAEAADIAKSRFLATMSHELRTPMSVLGMAQLLSLPGLQEGRRLEYAQTILQSGQALLTLLDDILDYSKIEAGRLELDLVPCLPRR
jgi:hypothetical protein